MGKKLLFDTATPAAPGYKLADGSDVTISDLSVGGDVLIGGTPAKAGDYTLDNGTTFTVGNDGKISAVTPVAQAAAAGTAGTLLDGTAVSYDTLAAGGILKGVDGNPVPAGTYTMSDNCVVVVGDGGVITSVTPAMPTTEADMSTAESRATFLANMLQKFADPAAPADGQMANIITCLKALMQYSFGWDIQQQAALADKQKAINILQTGFAAADKELKAAKSLIEKQDKALKLMFEAMAEIGEMPTGEAPEGPKVKSSAFSKMPQKEAAKARMIAAIGEVIGANAN